MGKERRLHTVWNSDPQNPRWQLLLSMRHSPNSHRRAIDIYDFRQDPAPILNLSDVEDLQEFLLSHPDYIYIGKREDTNRAAVVNRGKQQTDPSFFLNVSIAILGTLSIPALVNSITDFEKKNSQASTNSPVSFEHDRNLSAINLSVIIITVVLGLLIYFVLSHLRHHREIDAQRAFQYIDELLGRLQEIKYEITLKEKVLEKIETFLQQYDNNFKITNHLDTQQNLAKKENKQGKLDEEEMIGTANEATTFKDKLIAALDKEDTLDLYEAIDETLDKIYYPPLKQGAFLLLKIKCAARYSKTEFLKEAEINLEPADSIIDLLTLATSLPHDAGLFKDKFNPINFVFDAFIKLLKEKDFLLAQHTLFGLLISSFNHSKQLVSEIDLYQKMLKALLEKSDTNFRTVSILCRQLNMLKPTHRLNIISFIQDSLKKQKDIDEALTNILQTLFYEQRFLEISRGVSSSTSYIPYDPGLFSAHTQHLFKKSATQSAKPTRRFCELPDQRLIEVLGIQKTDQDGNCGFRAILGEGYLKKNDKLLTRAGVIALLTEHLDDKNIKTLISLDLRARYDEYVANIWLMESDKRFPASLKEKFKALKVEQQKEDNEEHQKSMEKKLKKFINKKKNILAYLTDYLAHDEIWPNVQGTLAAFGQILGIKIHCIIEESLTDTSLRYYPIDQNLPEPYEEVFILYNGARTHFDRANIIIYKPDKEMGITASQIAIKDDKVEESSSSISITISK